MTPRNPVETLASPKASGTAIIPRYRKKIPSSCSWRDGRLARPARAKPGMILIHRISGRARPLVKPHGAILLT